MKQRTGRRELIEEALAAHEAFRRLEVPAEEILVQVTREGRVDVAGPFALFVIVKRKDGFEFNYVCGPVASEQEGKEILAMWPKATAEWNQPDMKAECERIWRESNIGNSSVGLATAWGLKLMGFKARRNQ